MGRSLTLLLCFNFYLVIDGSIEFSSCIPGQGEKLIADWIINTDTWVWLGSIDKDAKSQRKMSIRSKLIKIDVCILKNILEAVRWSCLGLFPDLKHSLRRASVRGPAWYSSPPMMDGTRSSSSTNTAISLSLLPSMLRSLMLAEPGTHMACIGHH